MSIKVVYVSRKGNTKKVAEAIALGAGVSAESAENAKISGNIDTLFVGGSIYAGKLDDKLNRFLETLDGSKVKQVVAFGTAAGNSKTLDLVKKALIGKNIKICDEEYFCKGSFLLAHMGRPNQSDLKAAELFAAKFVKNDKKN